MLFGATARAFCEIDRMGARGVQFGVLVQVLFWGAGVFAIWGLCWCIFLGGAKIYNSQFRMGVVSGFGVGGRVSGFGAGGGERGEELQQPATAGNRRVPANSLLAEPLLRRRHIRRTSPT